MNRLESTLTRLRATSRKALIPYITAGDPFADCTPDLMHAMVESGANVIELGVPFSDPSADGPVIQQASERALARGISLTHVLNMVRQFRATDSVTPVVLMGYANPIERYEQQHGNDTFAQDASDAGVDGVLIVDYPPEECQDFAAKLKQRGISMIFLLAPTSTEQRMAQVAALANGYVYYVSLKGVTGSGSLNTAEVEAMLPRIRQHVALPIAVGFGIRDAETAKTIGRSADAVVIGSQLIRTIEHQPREQLAVAVKQFLTPIRVALDA